MNSISKTSLDIHQIPFKNINHETVYLPKNRVVEKRSSAYGICFSNKRILLVKSAYNGLWELPGGKIEEGETSIDAMIREFSEESSYEAPRGQEFLEVGQHQEYFHDSYNDLYFDSVMTFFIFEDEGKRHNRGLDEVDVTEFSWFNKKTILEIEIHPISKKFIKKAIQGWLV